VDLARQSDQLAECGRYMDHELPRRVRIQLEGIVHRASGPLESELQAQLIDIIRNEQRELFREYAANLNLPASANGAHAGLSTNEPATLDGPPSDPLGGIAALFTPPSVTDDNHLFSFEALLQNSGALHPPVGLSNVSDSAYSSQHASGLHVPGQDSSIGVQLPDGTADISLQRPGSEASANCMQQDGCARSNCVEPWLLCTHDGTHPCGELCLLDCFVA
jgi:hypothetical protein